HRHHAVARTVGPRGDPAVEETVSPVSGRVASKYTHDDRRHVMCPSAWAGKSGACALVMAVCFCHNAHMYSICVRHSLLFLRGVPYGAELWPTQSASAPQASGASP